MILARIKNLIKRALNWWRRRRDFGARLARLEHEVEALRNRIDTTSAFYERRLDATLRAAMDRGYGNRKNDRGPNAGGGLSSL
jgi:hypothetical protein